MGVLATEVADSTKATKATIEDWLVMMEWALMIARCCDLGACPDFREGRAEGAC